LELEVLKLSSWSSETVPHPVAVEEEVKDEVELGLEVDFERGLYQPTRR